jgi:hypothetical protein
MAQRPKRWAQTWWTQSGGGRGGGGTSAGGRGRYTGGGGGGGGDFGAAAGAPTAAPPNENEIRSWVTENFGIPNTFGTGSWENATHPKDQGWHGKGYAFDFHGTQEQMADLANWVAQNWAQYTLELIYSGPGFDSNNCIKNGKFGNVYGAAMLAEHTDHVHWAMTKAPSQAEMQAATGRGGSRVDMGGGGGGGGGAGGGGAGGGGGEQLGQSIISGMFQELGFPDVFGKPFTQWGAWKMGMAGLNYGMGLAKMASAAHGGPGGGGSGGTAGSPGTTNINSVSLNSPVIAGNNAADHITALQTAASQASFPTTGAAGLPHAT